VRLEDFSLLLFHLLTFPVYENKIFPADLKGISPDALLVFPGGGLDPAFNVKGDALADIGFDNFGGLVPENDVVPFGFLDLVAIPVGLDFIGGKREAGHLVGFIDLGHSGVVADVPHECGLVTCHPH
jgi:hypothetical protein